MLTILVPCAGEGKRFREAGYDKPKPLIDVEGEPMLKRVIDNLKLSGETRWIFVVNEVHGLYSHIKKWVPNSTVIQLGATPNGAACTALTAKTMIDNQEPLVIANCDQLIDSIPKFWLEDLVGVKDDAAILTMKGEGSKKWSYVSVTKSGNVVYVAEKQPMSSDRATCGIYFWKRGADFVRMATTMIEHGHSVNGEFYIAPSFNHSHDALVKEVRLEGYGAKFWGLGTPEDLEKYLSREK